MLGPGYWEAVTRPVPCLIFVLPLLIAYEAGVGVLGGSRIEAARTGADVWMRHALGTFGMTDRWLPPLAILVALLAWQAIERSAWSFRAHYLLGMAAESIALALALIGLSRLVDLGFSRLEGEALLAAGASSEAAALYVGFLGAGVYEEALFRLGLIPALFGIGRLLQLPQVVASTAAVTASALLFSLAHHAGAPGESFSWFAFIFRWLAGVYFAWIFLGRGFGVAVGTHAAYDILVGGLGVDF